MWERKKNQRNGWRVGYYLDDIFVGKGLVRFVVLGVLEEYFVHIGTGVLVELIAGGENDERDLAVAEDRQFVGFLHHPELAFVERHLHISIANLGGQLLQLPSLLVQGKGNFEVAQVYRGEVNLKFTCTFNANNLGRADGTFATSKLHGT